MYRKQQLSLLKGYLPKGYLGRASKMSGLSENTVRKFFKGLKVRRENGDDILDACVRMAKSTAARDAEALNATLDSLSAQLKKTHP